MKTDAKKSLNIVLLSGGSGKRLWPLSNDIRSKQFIRIFKNNNGDYESMAQRMYRGILEASPDADITIATGKSQISELRNQLGDDIHISVEPCRRDTFPAIALAASYLHDVRSVVEDQPIVVCPVDPYVDDDYFKALIRLSGFVSENDANITLLGIEPTYPSEKYGYIIPENDEEYSNVQGFREKPDSATASHYIEQGALWNAGIFAFRLGYILEVAHKLIDFSDYADLYARYESLNSISFDYAVVEKEKSIKVLRFSGIWKDLGTWNTLTEAMDEKIIGNAIEDDTCSNTHIINNLDIPVLAMGIDNAIISASPDGIIVSDKNQSSYIKPLVDRIVQPVRYAEKSWGSYRVLEVGTESMTIEVTLRAGHHMNYHSHDRRDEIWTIISGTGKTVVDEMEQTVKAGDVITIQAGCRHTVIADNELKLIEIQLGKDISVYDKKKYRWSDW